METNIMSVKKNGGIIMVKRVTYEELNVGDEYVYLSRDNNILNLDSDDIEYNIIAKVITDAEVKNRNKVVEVMEEYLKKMCYEDRQQYFNRLSMYE